MSFLRWAFEVGQLCTARSLTAVFVLRCFFVATWRNGGLQDLEMCPSPETQVIWRSGALGCLGVVTVFMAYLAVVQMRLSRVTSLCCLQLVDWNGFAKLCTTGHMQACDQAVVVSTTWLYFAFVLSRHWWDIFFEMPVVAQRIYSPSETFDGAKLSLLQSIFCSTSALETEG